MGRLVRISGIVSKGRVAVPFSECPNCGKAVDWHREWYSLPDQKELALGSASMKCLNCGESATYNPNTLSFNPSKGEPLKKREEERARKWYEDQMASSYPEGIEIV